MIMNSEYLYSQHLIIVLVIMVLRSKTIINNYLNGDIDKI